LVEQLIRNQQVAGSSPASSSKYPLVEGIFIGRMVEKDGSFASGFS
jgi:uncharacterized protein YgiB involved in biofilm formation